MLWQENTAGILDLITAPDSGVHHFFRVNELKKEHGNGKKEVDPTRFH